MKNIPVLPLILLILIIPLSVSSQELSLASMFSDAMVLQQKSSAPVWGKGSTGNNGHRQRFMGEQRVVSGGFGRNVENRIADA